MEDVQFEVPIRQFILHNGGDTTAYLTFSGIDIEIPARDKIQEPHPSRDKWTSAKDLDGNWIPGTLVIQDMHDVTTEELRFNAASAVRNLLGIAPNSKQATSAWYLRGISLLPPGAPKEQVADIVTSGIQRYEDFMVEYSRTVVADYEVIRQVCRGQGRGDPPLKPGVRKAFARLEQRAKEDQEAFARAKASIGDPTEDLAAEAEIEVIAMAEAEELARKVRPGDSPMDTAIQAELLAKLAKNPKVVALARSKYKLQVRRRGFGDPKLSKGDAKDVEAAQEILSAAEAQLPEESPEPAEAEG